ncbi:cache domain-containing protein [Zhihengliuella halotolerans]|uniref:cache domain-containing protein n=1 Tax=Zhihengliuella halotolerans TaxID=370736 RepID=UPI000C80212D|nr:cache domain-containing protein [Zhihengliuella halotolerans]
MAASHPAAADITAHFTRVIDMLKDWTDPLGALFDASDRRRPTHQEADAVIEPLAGSALEAPGSVLVGAGFIAAEDVLSNARWHMAWWQGASKLRLMSVSPAEAGEIYVRREWFTTPLELRRPHITGPYVDFLCTDEYTVTLSVPLLAPDPYGIVGADMFVAQLEPTVGPLLASISPTASLVNRSGRVLVSADPRIAAGTVLTDPWVPGQHDVAARDGGARVQLTGCGELPLAIAAR